MNFKREFYVGNSRFRSVDLVVRRLRIKFYRMIESWLITRGKATCPLCSRVLVAHKCDDIVCFACKTIIR